MTVLTTRVIIRPSKAVRGKQSRLRAFLKEKTPCGKGAGYMNIEKFTQKSKEALMEIDKIALDFGNQEVEQEHLLYALLGQDDSLIRKLLEKMEKSFQAQIARLESENRDLQSTAESMRLSILGKDSKVKDERPLEVVTAYIRENTTEVIDPLEAQKKAQELYSIEGNVEKIYNFYQKILSDKNES